MQSNQLYTKLLRHIFLIPTILAITIGINGYTGDAHLTVNGEPTTLDIYDFIIALAIGTITFCLWLLMKDKVVAVRLGGQNLTIQDGDSEQHINWHDIESLKQLPFISPPLYKFSVKNEEGFYLFITSPLFISYGFGSVDLSEMGGFLKQKRKHLGL